MNDGKKDYANRAYRMYKYYELFIHIHKSRKRKSYLRKIFNAWYKCPDYNGEYNEEYWKYPVDFNCSTTFREFIWKHNKCLTNNQIGCILRKIEEHILLNKK